MSQQITCPSCTAEFEITEVMSAQLGATIRADLESQYAGKAKQLTAQRRELDDLKKSLAEKEDQLAQQVQEALAKERGQLAKKLRVEAQQAVAVELEDRQQELRSTKEKLKSAQGQELQLRKKQRELEEQAEQQELDIARRMDQERKQIRETAQKQAQQANELKQADADQTIKTLVKQLDEMKRKAEQGSQQSQGEVQELVLEQMLESAFPNDVIEPVAKGVRGGDALHHVFDESGRDCGMILWESKRTKTWNDKWLGKAIDDQQEAKAACACIVSAVVPESVQQVDQINGVWVASWTCARSAATVLRHALIETAQARRATEGQQGKQELVYEYLSGPEFKNRVRGFLEPIATMEAELEKEKNAFQRVWNKRQKQLDRMKASSFGLYGDLQGILGNGLQEIEGMDVLALEVDEQSAALEE